MMNSTKWKAARANSSASIEAGDATSDEEFAALDHDGLPFTKFVPSTSNQVDDYENNAIMRDAFHGSTKPLVFPSTSDLIFKQPMLAHSLSSAGVAAGSNGEELIETYDILKQGGDKIGGVSLLTLPRDDKDKKSKKSDLMVEVNSVTSAASTKKQKAKGAMINEDDKAYQSTISSITEVALPTDQESDKRQPMRPRNHGALVLTDDGGNKKRPKNAVNPVVLTHQSQREQPSSPNTISTLEMLTNTENNNGRKSASPLTSNLAKRTGEEDKKHQPLSGRTTKADVLAPDKEDRKWPPTSPRETHVDHEADRKLRRSTKPRMPYEDSDDHFIMDEHLIEGYHNSTAAEKGPLHMVSHVPPSLSMAALVSPTDAVSFMDEEEFSESQCDSDESDPVVLGVGIPEDAIVLQSLYMARSPSTDRVGSEETKEELQERSPRQKTVEERDAELIDGLLAENIGIDETNAKGGKKALPEMVDATSILRRQSSRIACTKELSYQRSAEFSIGSVHTPVSPFYSPPGARAITSSPVYGDRRAVGNLIEEYEGDLAAHAGIPVFGGEPGAYSMPGVSGPERAESGAFSDLSDFHGHERFRDEELGPPTTEFSREPTSTFQTIHTTAAEGIETGIDADVPRQQMEVVVDGQVVNPEDGLTDEERALRKWKGRRLVIGIAILAIALITSAVVVASRSETTPPIGPTVDAWVPLGGTLLGPPVDDDIFFGRSVSLDGSGKRGAFGIPGIDKSNSDNDVGQVQIFDIDPTGTQWALTATLEFDAREGGAGRAVSMSKDGRRVAVGSPAWSNEIGLISIFEDDGNNQWQQIGGDISGSESDGEKGSFGSVVAISADGKIVAAAAPFANTEFASEGGVVRVYKEVDSEWVQLGADIVSTRDRALLGISIALSADGLRLAIGATNFDTQVDIQVVGQVRVFDFNGSDWVQKGQILDGSSEFEIFGNAVALNAAGNVLAVGANGSSGADDRVNSGKVQVFELVDALWTQVGGDILGRKSENLGASVALSDDGILAIGSPTYREIGVETGRVKAYMRNSATGWTQIGNAINGASEGETFGISIAISSNGTVIGSGAPKASFDGGRVQEVGLVRIYQNKQLLASPN